MLRPHLAAAVLVLAVPLSGCSVLSPGGGRPPEEMGEAEETVTVETVDGEVTVPVTDTGIWALDPQTALNLLALGVVPEHAGRFDRDLDPFVAAAHTILEEAGVEMVEGGNAELVAAAEPRLIVGGAGTGSDEVRSLLDAIAPVVMLPAVPVLEDDLDTLGAVTGHGEEAAAVAGRLDAALEDSARRIRDSEFDGVSVSVLSACGAGTFCLYGTARGFGPVLTGLGLSRPPSQADRGNEWGYGMFSPENLGDQRAEVVIALVGSVSYGAPSPLTNPLLDTSGSRTGEVDFAAWYGVGPLNRLWVLHDLDAILFGEGRVAGETDGPDLWAEVVG